MENKKNEENVYPKEEIISLRFQITASEEVVGHSAEIHMLYFEGETNTKWFQGKTLPGSIDTQVWKEGQNGKLSARYMLDGVDCEGKKCRIFIENNGEDDRNGHLNTVPMVVTDSDALAWLEDAKLYGYLSFEPEYITVHVCSTGEKRN